MDITARRMSNNVGNQSTLQVVLDFILQFFKDGWPMISAIAIGWKTIDKVAEWWAKKQDARLRLLISQEVKPQISELHESIDRLTKMIGSLEAKIKP